MDIRQLLSPEGWLVAGGGPRYVQLRKRIEWAIENEMLVPGDPLPPEREIAALTTLSRVTVRKAVEPLVQQGLIVQRRGSGSVVSRPVRRVEQSLSRLTSLTDDMARRGVVVTSEWLSRGVFDPTPEETMTLGLSRDDMVVRLVRRRMAEGVPLAVERASLPGHILPDPSDVGDSLYKALEASGKRPVRAIQRISATNLNSEDAGILGLEEGIAVLAITRVSYLASGKTIELTHSVYRGDAYDFVAELRLAGDTGGQECPGIP
jgi:GntR family transcriptional regulator